MFPRSRSRIWPDPVEKWTDSDESSNRADALARSMYNQSHDDVLGGADDGDLLPSRDVAHDPAPRTSRPSSWRPRPKWPDTGRVSGAVRTE